MRIYTLQIKEPIDGKMDELFHFTQFENLRLEFLNKLNYYRSHSKRVISEQLPELDGCEVCGDFLVELEDGKRVYAKAYDYDILDD